MVTVISIQLLRLRRCDFSLSFNLITIIIVRGSKTAIYILKIIFPAVYFTEIVATRSLHNTKIAIEQKRSLASYIIILSIIYIKLYYILETGNRVWNTTLLTVYVQKIKCRTL